MAESKLAGPIKLCNHPISWSKLAGPTFSMGVYKQWTGLLEWWNTGMVDWIIFVLAFIIYHTISTS